MKERILSVGIDIGTSTTLLVFSRITIENTASLVSAPRIKIVGKEVIYQSDIHFTPLKSPREIDSAKLGALVEMEYARAGVKPAEVQTGAVIITGETARKENAAEVQKALSRFAGEFVVAVAGPALEGIIAGKGAGADEVSHRRGAIVANLDIGGGTTNIAVFKNGEVLDTACLDIGGRLVQVADGRITYLADKMARLAQQNNIPLKAGQAADSAALRRLAQRMAEVLEEAVGTRPPSGDLAMLVTDKDLKRDCQIEYLSFSGGVADCIEEPGAAGDFPYGDIGAFLGRAVGRSKLASRMKLLPSRETIRATVVGAGTHTMDISGSTVLVRTNALPLQNIPVLKLTREDESLPFGRWESIIREKLSWFNLESERQTPALAFRGRRGISFEGLQQLARGIAAGMDEALQGRSPLIVIVEKDLAKALGHALLANLGPGQGIICIDTVKVENGDYIDIGRQLAGGAIVPVIVKTLLFDY